MNDRKKAAAAAIGRARLGVLEARDDAPDAGVTLDDDFMRFCNPGGGGTRWGDASGRRGRGVANRPGRIGLDSRDLPMRRLAAAMPSRLTPLPGPVQANHSAQTQRVRDKNRNP